MRHRFAATALATLVLTGGALAQTAQPTAPQRQPRPAAGTPAAAPSNDLDATRKRFEANAARQAELDRKRDAKLNHSMRSICSGCDAPEAKTSRR